MKDKIILLTILILMICVSCTSNIEPVIASNNILRDIKKISIQCIDKECYYTLCEIIDNINILKRNKQLKELDKEVDKEIIKRNLLSSKVIIEDGLTSLPQYISITRYLSFQTIREHKNIEKILLYIQKTIEDILRYIE